MSEEKKKSKVVGYVIGSAALCAATAVVIPKVLPTVSGKINKLMTKRKNAAHDEDDWGPEVEKKDSEKGADNEN